MSDTSPSTASTAADVPASIDMLARAPIKRARPQLSCTPCRQGKLKCNREHPICDQCAKRSRHEACQYVPPPTRNKQAQNMRGRIRNLESLVVDLITQKEQEQQSNGNQTAKPDLVKDAEDVASETFGQLSINSSGNETYVGAGHWSALLNEIEEVKNSLDEGEVEESQDDEWNDASARSSVTFGMPRHLSKAQLIEEMPPKEEVDRLLPLWFNSADPLLYIIHGPTFQEEYNQFWIDQSSVSAMWLALLYSALALGIVLGPRNPGMHAHAAAYDRSNGSALDPIGENDFLSSSANKFQQLASSAFVLADISKSQPYTLEALMIYGECEFLRRDDHHSKIWLMNGVSLRVAMRMGYHRDPSNFPQMSPFQGEMRRRAWHVLNMMDTLVSFAIGLPTVVRRIESDVRPPRNLYDADISPNMTGMPKERPASEITPASYTIAKSRVAAVFAEAAEQYQRITPPRYTTIVALEKRLEEAHNRIPELMRVRRVEDSIADPPVLIMSRFNIELLYLKTKLVLHRTYLTAGQTDPRFAESRKLCVDASMEILGYHKTIFHACQPGGQLSKVWWYMASLQSYDYLLAAMILSLEMNHLQSTDASAPRVSQIFGILEDTYDIWANHPNRFRESVRGAEILRTMLKKCSAAGQSQVILQDPVPNGFEKNISSWSKKMTPESLTNDLSNDIWNAFPPTDSSLDMPDFPSEIDWTVWDSAMQNQESMLPPQAWASTNNSTMETWLGATWNADQMISNGLEGFQDSRDSLNIYGPSIFTSTPPPPPLDPAN